MVETTSGSGSPLGDGVDMFRRRRDAFRVQSARGNEADAVVGCTSNSGVVLKKIRSLDALSAVLPNVPAPGISARRAAPVKLPGLDVRAGAVATHLRESKGMRGLVKWRSCDSGVEMAHVESLPPSPLVPGVSTGWSSGRGDGSSSLSDETEPETELDAPFRAVAALTAPAAVSQRSARSAALHDDGRRTMPPDVATGASEGSGARDHLGGRLDGGARGRSLSDETRGSSGMSSSTNVSLAWSMERGNASSDDDLNSVESWEEYINNHTQLNQMRCEGELTPGSGLCHLDQLCRLMEKMGHLKEANKKLQQQSQQLQAELQAQRLHKGEHANSKYTGIRVGLKPMTSYIPVEGMGRLGQTAARRARATCHCLRRNCSHGGQTRIASRGSPETQMGSMAPEPPRTRGVLQASGYDEKANLGQGTPINSLAPGPTPTRLLHHCRDPRVTGANEM